MKEYHKEGYWKDWYWNKGGRDKVQASRKERAEIKKKEPIFKHIKYE